MDPRILFVAVSLVLAANPAQAKKAKPPPEPDLFTPFEEELLQTSGFDEADGAALKQMRRCHGFDEKWNRQLLDPHNFSLDDTEGTIRVSVVCWEKIGKKHPTGHEGVDTWVAAWHRFVQGTAMWLEGQRARLEVDRDRCCSRLDTAEEILDDAVVQAEAVPARFTTPTAAEVATHPLQAASQMRAQVKDLKETVGCP